MVQRTVRALPENINDTIPLADGTRIGTEWSHTETLRTIPNAVFAPLVPKVAVRPFPEGKGCPTSLQLTERLLLSPELPRVANRHYGRISGGISSVEEGPSPKKHQCRHLRVLRCKRRETSRSAKQKT